MSGDLYSAGSEVQIYWKQLRACRAAFDAIVERIADGVVVLLSEGTIAFANPAAEKLLGRPAGDLYGERLAAELNPGVCEMQVRTAEEAVRTLELHIVETEWQSREALLVTMRDVTEQRNAVRKARDEIRRRDEFLAILSHELRNPLAAVRNAARVLQRTAPGEGASNRSVEVIERQCHQMTRLLDELLEVSRISQGKIRLHCRPLDLRDAIREALDAVGTQIDQFRHRLHVEIPDAPIPVNGDAARLNQVFANLLANSARYTNPGGLIQLRVECDPNEATVRVIDNGIGIPADILGEIFEPFVQGNHSLARSDSGMGLGLSLVQRLVEMHGGSVRASSAGPGKGSEFVVRVPLLPSGPPLPAAETVTGPESIPRLRLLIVEDNADVREMLKTILELDGHEVGVAADGHQAVEMIELHRPDAAIVDIGLPGLNGYEVAQAVRGNPENRGVRLIALTGYGQDDDRRRAEAAGFDAHLVKPVDLKRLNAVLAEDSLLGPLAGSASTMNGSAVAAAAGPVDEESRLGSSGEESSATKRGRAESRLRNSASRVFRRKKASPP